MKNQHNQLIRISLLALILLPGLISCKSNNEKDQKYNVLFIAVDDLRTELNCYGAGHIYSPNIDRLATEGVRFTRAYVQQSICMASRASLMTGYRPERLGIYTGESVHDLVPGALTMNKHFEENGYAVSGFGKIYHFSTDQHEQFGEEFMDPTNLWAGRGYLKEESIEQMKYNEAHPVKGRNHPDRGPAFEWADVPDSAYIDGYNTEYALRKLKQYKRDGKPFFMAMGFHKPHLPFVAPQKYWDMYPPESIRQPERQHPPENVTKYTLRSWGELRNYYGMPKTNALVSTDTTLILRQGYYACVTYVDALIGRLLDELQGLGLAENTIVILWGDHGYKLGDYSYWCKWTNMDIDTRVPLIISVPGGKKNVTSDALVELLDMYPTLADLCGLELPEHLEGRSLKPALDDPEIPWVEEVYSVWPHDRKDYNKTVMGYCVKTERYNYTEWVQLNTGEVLARDLYDHETDPGEMKNVIDDPAYVEEIRELEKKCAEKKQATDHDHLFRQKISQTNL